MVPDPANVIHQPFDPTTISISTRQPTVYQIVERVKNDEIDLQPDFQRSGDVWPLDTQSRLIESLLLRIPIPVFYVAADTEDNWQVVDGLQRLTTLRNFILGDTDRKLHLRGMEYLAQFDGSTYDVLPRPMQRRINETQLSCHVIEPGTPAAVMFNVFKRINTEGKPLKGQEIRHALNPGPARGLLRELAESQEFKRATDDTVNPKRMADRECVLRFMAFRAWGEDRYPGRLDEFLMDAMGWLNENQESYPKLNADFRRAMSLAAEIFGHEAFRKPPRDRPAIRRFPVNKPLFESLSVVLAEVPEDRASTLVVRKEDVVRRLKDLMKNRGFHDSITVGTQSTKHVNIRFARVRSLIQEALS